MPGHQRAEAQVVIKVVVAVQVAEVRAREAEPRLSSDVKLPLHRPWTLPPQGLAVFYGGGNTARLSHYFLPRLLREGKRVLMLDGANCADPRLLERLARQRGVPFAKFSRQIEIARAFTCFQLTELIARVPQLLANFPAQALIVTAFPELYYDEDVRDWDARQAFEQALANLRRWPEWRAVAQVAPGFSRAPVGLKASASASRSREPFLNPNPLPRKEDVPPAAGRVGDNPTAALPITVAVFSAALDFAPPPARRDHRCHRCPQEEARAREVLQVRRRRPGSATGGRG